MNEELLQKIRQCPTLPSLPAIAVQVLELTQKPDADISEIARIISKDAALSAKILRTVNSSFYGRSQNVSTISHALVILGLQSVKTLVLGFSLVTNLTKNKSKGFKHIAYWKRSIFAATSARVLANKIGMMQQEEAFLASLLMDIGMLVFDQVITEQYGEIYANTTTHDQLPAVEKEALDLTHAQVGGFIAEQWKLPPLLSVPVTSHHNADEVADPTLKKMTLLVGLSGRMADIFVDENAAPAIADVRAACRKYFNIAEPEVDLLLADVAKRTKEAASLFEINIGSSAGFDAILKKANEQLVEITLQSQMQASALQQQNQQLKVEASTDGLTSLANRATFDKFLSNAFADCTKSGQPLAVLMIDLDKFKTINDTYGHSGGDQVLRVVGRIVKTLARKSDLAARYGGEEMAMVLPNTTRAMAVQMAETFRRAVAARPVLAGPTRIPVTASVGVCSHELGSPFTQSTQLLKAADLALYNAKGSGRNCVRVIALKTAAPVAQMRRAG